MDPQEARGLPSPPTASGVVHVRGPIPGSSLHGMPLVALPAGPGVTPGHSHVPVVSPGTGAPPKQAPVPTPHPAPAFPSPSLAPVGTDANHRYATSTVLLQRPIGARLAAAAAAAAAGPWCSKLMMPSGPFPRPPLAASDAMGADVVPKATPGHLRAAVAGTSGVTGPDPTPSASAVDPAPADGRASAERADGTGCRSAPRGAAAPPTPTAPPRGVAAGGVAAAAAVTAASGPVRTAGLGHPHPQHTAGYVGQWGSNTPEYGRQGGNDGAAAGASVRRYPFPAFPGAFPRGVPHPWSASSQQYSTRLPPPPYGSAAPTHVPPTPSQPPAHEFRQPPVEVSGGAAAMAVAVSGIPQPYAQPVAQPYAPAAGHVAGHAAGHVVRAVDGGQGMHAAAGSAMPIPYYGGSAPPRAWHHDPVSAVYGVGHGAGAGTAAALHSVGGGVPAATQPYPQPGLVGTSAPTGAGAAAATTTPATKPKGRKGGRITGRKRRPKGRSSRCCARCRTTTTPKWRRSVTPDGVEQTLCNACGLRVSKHT